MEDELQEIVSPTLSMSTQSVSADEAPPSPEFMTLNAQERGLALRSSVSENLHLAAPYLNFVENDDSDYGSEDEEPRGRLRPNRSRTTPVGYSGLYAKRASRRRFSSGGTSSVAAIVRARSQVPTTSANRRCLLRLEHSESMPSVAVRSPGVFARVHPLGLDENVNNTGAGPARINRLPIEIIIRGDPEQDSDVDANFRRQALNEIREMVGIDVLILGQEIEAPDGELIGRNQGGIEIERMNPDDYDDEQESESDEELPPN